MRQKAEKKQNSMENQESRKPLQKGNSRRLFLPISCLVLLFMTMIGVTIVCDPDILFFRSDAMQSKDPITEFQSAPEALLTEAFKESEEEQTANTEQTVSGNHEAAMEGDPFVTEPGTKPDTESMSQREEEFPIRLTDLAVFNKEKAILQCYEPDAQSYHWEVYSDLDKQWMEASKKSGIKIELLPDQSGRKISTLTIHEDDISNLEIRCTVSFSDDREPVISKSVIVPYSFQDEDPIKSVSIPEFKTDIGTVLSSLKLPVVLEKESGKKIELSGIQSLIFCLEQEEESSRTYDEENSLTTDTYKKIYYETKFYPVKSGTENVQLRCQIMEEEFELEASITGVDQTAPEIETVQADYAVANVDQKVPIRIQATVTDNVDTMKELEFAFAHETIPEEKLNWIKEMPIQADIARNGLYHFYAKDKAGNISNKEIEITTVDMKAPVVETVELQRSEKAYTLTVIAKDKTKLEYSLYQAVDQDQKWQEQDSFIITKNGDYLLKVKDAAGNETAYADSVKITDLDHTAPIITGIEEIDETEERIRMEEQKEMEIEKENAE